MNARKSLDELLELGLRDIAGTPDTRGDFDVLGTLFFYTGVAGGYLLAGGCTLDEHDSAVDRLKRAAQARLAVLSLLRQAKAEGVA